MYAEGIKKGNPLKELSEFDKFWAAYPARLGQKKGKKQALDVWARKKLDGKALEIMLALSVQIEHKAACHRAGKFCQEFPDAHRWLRNESWTDEVATPPKTNGQSNVEQKADNEPESLARWRAMVKVVAAENPDLAKWKPMEVQREASRRLRAERDTMGPGQ